MLLAIDTSAGSSVAVVDLEGGILAQEDEESTRRHAEVVGTLILRALERAGVAPRDLSGVAAGMGPGPFTGLRVGIAAARAFALGIGRPVVPIASHDALALDAAEPIAVVTDARRRELAWSAYAASDELGLPVRVAGPALAAADAIDAAIVGFRRVDAATIPAGPLGMLAERRYAAGRPFGPSEPLYLRAPDVTVPKGVVVP
ncbi:tRNA (adenosine(37)-N6)-threonylcarbamoyltransferase complex dimerization subunit type 1 TsaB [Pseudolysinimonas sp.]|uniref:tRNA (adenosine(37)-N6)-threonylcarbamoyltransferase complex dimerization subunit type 1 TsaB n=1 Tax=Pseudolysinimonas sp. TaxID=2680009 RepID=UPI003F7CF29C